MSKKKYRCVPLDLMRKVEGEYPEAWEQMAYFHSLRGSDPDMQWPEWCYAPMAAASAQDSRRNGEYGCGRCDCAEVFN